VRQAATTTIHAMDWWSKMRIRKKASAIGYQSRPKSGINSGSRG